ncbi:acetyl-CoA hydrolase/transferase C-terminal domain-containing protein [Paracoccus alkenifer]|uniref:Acyl-CoA hydrolase n=1 Tax=Paracoccus alkenifer TaxID=65735 RepID=A0A1H6NH28_9RHOB|nr:acetyl-CoA hydrolase/transferase C-terminal domain-containing protein [Paracoccus alkenifer]SEI12232.1 Acyl-CoA hydrolase [Paracoccus alkenifer]
MAPLRIGSHDIAGHIPAGSRVWLHACSGESALIREGLEAADLRGLTFTGIFVPGLNRLGGLLAAGGRFDSYFMMPEFAGHDAQVRFLPFCYRDIRLHLGALLPDVALVMVSPPDEQGMCSLGPVNDFIADIWPQIPRIIAHVNPLVPRTQGRSIPHDRLHAVIEGESPLPMSNPGTDEVSTRIAALAAGLIPEGAAIQAGLGRAPEAVLSGLTGHRNLSIHSGLIGNSTLDLLDAGALRNDAPIRAGVAIGGARLYDAVGRPEFRFAPPSVTHDLAQLATTGRFVTINSAIEVDLAGNSYAEATPKGPVSGPGGASDFAAGARGLQGLRLVVLPATAAGGRISRIVSPGRANGPVSLGRFDTDVIITEYGIADLRAASPTERRERLIAIAAPEHRDRLADG